jgi:hypothetical protein
MNLKDGSKVADVLQVIGFQNLSAGNYECKLNSNKLKIRVETNESTSNGKKKWIEMQDIKEVSKHKGSRALFVFDVYFTNLKISKEIALPSVVSNYKVGTEFAISVNANGYATLLQKVESEVE